MLHETTNIKKTAFFNKQTSRNIFYFQKQSLNLRVQNLDRGEMLSEV